MALIGTSIKRVEDRRLLTGAGRFVGDLRRAGMVHAAVGYARMKDRLGAESHAAVVSRLRAELEAELVAGGLAQYVEPGKA